jgi:hypothetical protein
MKFSRLKRVIRETLEEQAHWWGAGPGYNPPVGADGEIIPGDWIYYNNTCEDCSQGQPISYQCYGPNPPTLYSSLQACQNATGVSGCTNPLATNYDPLATIDDGSCLLPCVQSDWMYNSTCGQQHLGPAPGGKNSWNPWITIQWNAFGNAGCYQLGSIKNYTTQQILPTTNCPAIYQGYGGERNNGTCLSEFQIKRKIGKIGWAMCLKDGKCNNNNAPGCFGSES